MKKLYGGTGLLHGYCEKCDDYTFADSNRRCLSCKTTIVEKRGVKRETETRHPRKPPSPLAQKQILDAQHGRCRWCQNTFGHFARKRRTGRLVELRVAWDHFVPYAYTGSCEDLEFVAACHICNGAKSAHMFDTEDECAMYLARRFDAGHEMIGDAYDLAVWLESHASRQADAYLLLGKADASRSGTEQVLSIMAVDP